jgi:hypothetical protein
LFAANHTLEAEVSDIVKGEVKKYIESAFEDVILAFYVDVENDKVYVLLDFERENGRHFVELHDIDEILDP